MTAATASPVTTPTPDSLGGRPDHVRGPGRRPRRWSLTAPRTSSRAATVLGLLSVFGPLCADHWSAVHRLGVVPAPQSAGAQAATIVTGLLLLRVAAGLRRARRMEWLVAVLACALLATIDLTRDVRRPVEAAVGLSLLVWLLLTRSRFTASRGGSGWWFAARAGALASVASLAYGLMLLALPGHVPAGTSVDARLAQAGSSFVGLRGTLTLRGDRFADLFTTSMAGLGLLVGCLVMLLILRPAAPVPHQSEQDERKLRALLAKHGFRDSLGYFALRCDKDVVWSPTGKAAVAYRVVRGVALASGDPIGDPEAWPGAIAAYLDLTTRHGWTPAVMACSELGATVYRRDAGLSALGLGDEAMLCASGFGLDGRAMRGVRQACNRTARAGYTVRVRRVADLSRAELAELRIAADTWRVDPTERGYSMALSRLGGESDTGCVVVTATQEGRVRGLLHFVPWGMDGLSLDVMRRDKDSDNGLNELMIAGVMHACRSLGIERVSLNFAMFRDALERGQRIGAGPVLRLWCRMLMIASRFWQIDSLYRFNDKFAPTWQPRFISFASARDLPRITIATLEAEGFLTWPTPLRRLTGRS